MPVETLLYGDRKERRAVLLRRAAWGVVAVYLALLLFCSLSLLVMNLSLPLDEIRLSAELANLRLFLVNRIWYPISRLPSPPPGGCGCDCCSSWFCSPVPPLSRFHLP